MKEKTCRSSYCEVDRRGPACLPSRLTSWGWADPRLRVSPPGSAPPLPSPRTAEIGSDPIVPSCNTTQKIVLVEDELELKERQQK